MSVLMASAAEDVVDPASPEYVGPPIVSGRRRAFRTFLKNRTAVVGVALIIVLVVIAIGAPLFAPHDPLDQSVRNRNAPPSADYILGRDDKGRDVFSRVIYGTKIALQVGIFSVLLGGVLGTLIGVTAAFFGGKVDV